MWFAHRVIALLDLHIERAKSQNLKRVVVLPEDKLSERGENY